MCNSQYSPKIKANKGFVKNSHIFRNEITHFQAKRTSKGNRKYYKLNENKTTTNANLWSAMKSLLKNLLLAWNLHLTVNISVKWSQRRACF